MKTEVLIVEDDEVVAFLQKSILEECGISSSPICFINGEEALNYLKRNSIGSKNILILLDINMPVMDGWGFLDAIEEINQVNHFEVIVYMVTSSVQLSDRERASKYKIVNGFIDKPLNIQTCLEIKLSFEARYFFSKRSR